MTPLEHQTERSVASSEACGVVRGRRLDGAVEYEALYHARNRDGQPAAHTQPSVHETRGDSILFFGFITGRRVRYLVSGSSGKEEPPRERKEGRMSVDSEHEVTPEDMGAFQVTSEDIGAFQRDGHVFLPAVVPQDALVKLRPIVKQIVGDETKDLPLLEERDTFGKAFRHVWGLQEKSDELQPFIFARRFAQIAADLMSVPSVRFFYSQAFFKEPGGGFTAWHVDQVYWPLDTEHSITMWVPLIDVSAKMGALQFASGSHKGDHQHILKISDDSEAGYQRIIEEKGWKSSEVRAMNAGDATFHSGWALHRAPGNETSITREVMSIVWFADGARLAEGKDEEWDWKWFPGQKPGELAGGPLTPVLYTREDH